jgi:hypothetical protein
MLDFYNPDGTSLTPREMDEIREEGDITFCQVHVEAFDLPFCPRCHVGVCAVCGEPVAKGREEVHEGDVFHRYLDASGRCEA